MDFPQVNQRRWWYVLLAVGLVLQVTAVMTSDLGLDAHVRLNVAMDEGDPGHDYPWGPTRHDADQSLTLTSSGEYDGYIGPWFVSELAVKIGALAGLLTLVALAGVVPRWRHEDIGYYDPRWGALIAWSPPMIFATGRGYDEAFLAIFLGLCMVPLMLADASKSSTRRLTYTLMATSVLLVLAWKGFGMGAGLLAFCGTLVVGWLWEFVDAKLSLQQSQPVTQRPWQMAFWASSVTMVLLVVLSLTQFTGTLGVLGEYPVQFLLAFVLAIIDGVGIFILVGFCLWPFLRPLIQSGRHAVGHSITMVATFVSVLTVCVLFYIASLWVLEATLWNASVFETAFLLGNNGRYLTLIILPLILLVHLLHQQAEPSIGFESSVDKRALVVGLLLLVPFTLFTSLVGQQLWTEEAGVAMDGYLSENSTFFIVSEPSLAVHLMYSLKTQVDLTGEENISAIWVDPSYAASLLDEQRDISYVLVAPDTSFTPSNSTLVDTGDAPSTFTQSLTDSTWSIFRINF